MHAFGDVPAAPVAVQADGGRVTPDAAPALAGAPAAPAAAPGDVGRNALPLPTNAPQLPLPRRKQPADLLDGNADWSHFDQATNAGIYGADGRVKCVRSGTKMVVFKGEFVYGLKTKEQAASRGRPGASRWKTLTLKGQRHALLVVRVPAGMEAVDKRLASPEEARRILMLVNPLTQEPGGPNAVPALAPAQASAVVAAAPALWQMLADAVAAQQQALAVQGQPLPHAYAPWQTQAGAMALLLAVAAQQQAPAAQGQPLPHAYAPITYDGQVPAFALPGAHAHAQVAGGCRLLVFCRASDRLWAI